MKTTLTFKGHDAGSLFWNHVVNFKDVVGIVGKGQGLVDVEVVAQDIDKLPMRIRQIRAFADDCGMTQVAN